jgi:5-(carboxyamino)imidazole ribonucleotide mutase
VSNNPNPIVVILMGSAADREHCAPMAKLLGELEIEFVQRIGSAHKTPEHVLQIIDLYESADRCVVWITVAGRSNALSAFVDAKVVSPVISCPPLSITEDVWSSLRMPSDVSPLVVLDPKNAALAAAKIVAQNDPELRKRIMAHKAREAAKVTAADAEITA